MRASSSDIFTTARVEGAVLPADLLQRVAGGDARLEGIRPEDYHLSSEKVNEATNHAWNRLLPVWDTFKSWMESAPPGEKSTKDTLTKWLLPFWRTLDYGHLVASKPFVIDEKSYPISHVWQHSPIHLVGYRHEIDKRLAASDGRQFSPHGLVQEFLNRSEAHLWGFVSNGLKLRILRDNVRLTRQAFVEFDLQAMFEGRVYSDFALLWRLCHESRVAADKPEQCWLEKWSKIAQDQGLRALDQLRTGVEHAIVALGRGFLACSANTELLDRLRSGTLHRQDYFRQLLRLVYRLLFIFVAEDRELLFAPSASNATRDRYRRFYSTAKLRQMAEKLRGTQHTDLYEGLNLILAKLGTTGCEELGLPALGGLLDPGGTPDLAGCRLPNSDLLEAVRSLAIVDDGKSNRRVDYRNLGSDELGSVYVSLLELHPLFDASAGTFSLETASGHERKTTGSHYTPTSLITCLLDSALDPVLDEACRKPDPEKSILALRVCDTAAGSGHFLIAAANRIAKRLAAERTGEAEPPPEAIRHAMRDVIGHCIFGVDINPMAVELCKVALWMEALEPGKPLSFLDHHIQCGNSLLGATPALLAKGIPDAAFEPIEGDDKKLCSAFKRQNKQERQGYGDLFEDAYPWERLGNLAAALAEIDTWPDETAEHIRSKEERYRTLVEEGSYRNSGRFLADIWCAAFVWKKNASFDFPVTEKIFRRIESNPHDVTPWMYEEVRRLSAQYKFFHWHLAFPGVFRPPLKDEAPDSELTGWCGTFDVVLGNPPWDRIKLQEQEWFASHGRPDITEARTASHRAQMIRQLQTSDPALHSAFLDDRRKSEGESHFVRDSSDTDEVTGRRWGQFPLCGHGDVNTYSIFAELNRNLVGSGGRVGCIVPSGIATDDTTKAFFQDLVETRTLASIYHFENEEKIFPEVHNAYRFVLLTIAPAEAATFVFYARKIEDLAEPDRRFSLSPEDIRLLSPNTRTCPTFRSNRDAVLSKRVYRLVPVLIRDGLPSSNPWHISFVRMLDMANDSGLFRAATDLQNEDWELNGNIFHRGNEQLLPLYEGKMIWHFDHRFGTYEGQTQAQANKGFLPQLDEAQHANANRVPQSEHWVAQRETISRIPDDWARDWLVGWRDITGVEKSRTVVVAILPRVAVGHTAPLAFPDVPAPQIAMLVANLCSFMLDYCARQKIGGTHLTYGYLKQLPVLPPSTFEQRCAWSPNESVLDWVLPRVVELIYTAWDVQPFGVDCGFDGPPIRWDDERRFQIRCELDAALFHLYLGNGAWHLAPGETDADLSRLRAAFATPRDVVAHVLGTFPIVKRLDIERFGNYRTSDTILARYDDMATAIQIGKPFVTCVDPPPADPRVAHPPRGTEPASMPRPSPAIITTKHKLLEPSVVVAAFEAVRDGWSPDYVVACPEFNQRFLAAIRETGATASDLEVNMALLNARKAGKLKGKRTTKEYRLPAEVEPWSFASEWAVRHLQRELLRESNRLVALDEILCSPVLATRFDEIATRIKPGLKPLEYRWTALGMRKRGKAKPTPKSLVIALDRLMTVADGCGQAPKGAGLYLIRSASRPLYINHADDLRLQLDRHRQLAGDRFIPDWLLTESGPPDSLAYAYLAGMDPERLREVRISGIAQYRPWLNLLDLEGAA